MSSSGLQSIRSILGGFMGFQRWFQMCSKVFDRVSRVFQGISGVFHGGFSWVIQGCYRGFQERSSGFQVVPQGYSERSVNIPVESQVVSDVLRTIQSRVSTHKQNKTP